MYGEAELDDPDQNRAGGAVRIPHKVPLGIFVVLALIVGFVFVIGPRQALGDLGERISSILKIHRPMTMLENSGVILLNVSELKDHIVLPIHGKHRRYWIGPITGSRYTTNDVTPGVLKVSYFKANQTLANQTMTDGILPFLSVTAYEDQTYYVGELRAITGDLVKMMTNSSGDALEIDATSFVRMTIRPKYSQEIITINYSTPQSIVSMVHDSEILATL